jgi:hypothetical protein
MEGFNVDQRHNNIAVANPSTPDAQANSSARFLDVDGLVRYLGVPKSWIYDRTGPSAPDRIPHFKIGKYVRFDINAEEFKGWLQRNFRI